MPNTPTPANMPSGVPIATPAYQVDAQGNPITGANPGQSNLAQVGGVAVQNGVEDVSVGGRSSLAIAAGVAADTIVKAAAGRLCRILVTTTGTAAMLIYDNASTHAGTIIGEVPANATAGTLIDVQAPAANGITVAGSLNNPAVTIFFD